MGKQKKGIKGRTKELKDFLSDGCTLSPDFEFYDCCYDHDVAYHFQHCSRWAADRRLRQCIRAEGYILLPWIYWVGVRLAGWLFWE